jgi:NhaP-type Na+/H+ or K+/H+ antiporter
MTEYPIFLFIALLILAFGLFSRLSERSVITAPMVFVTIGIITSFFPYQPFKNGINAPLVRILSELTLVMVLFLDASTINLKELIKERKLPMRLLFIGLPLTMIAGFLVAIPMFPGINLWVLLLMALILSPTDAALGLAVVTSKRVPQSIRQTINVESGLNDGIALPPILICMAALSQVESSGSGLSYWVFFVLKQFIYGPLIGGAIGWTGGLLVDRAAKKEWMNPTFQNLSAIALAVLAYSVAEIVHGNGFISAYFAGLMLGTRTLKVRERIHDFGESESQVLVLVIFLLFGLILVPQAFPFWNLSTWLYAILSLTVIRMVPVAVSLLGTRLSWKTIGFIGWFGPRGIASILYLLLVVLQLGVAGYERMISLIVLTILLSVFLHGISAYPLSRLYRESSG